MASPDDVRFERARLEIALQALADDACSRLEEMARAALREHPTLQSYICDMGESFFTGVIGIGGSQPIATAIMLHGEWLTETFGTPGIRILPAAE